MKIVNGKIVESKKEKIVVILAYIWLAIPYFILLYYYIRFLRGY